MHLALNQLLCLKVWKCKPTYRFTQNRYSFINNDVTSNNVNIFSHGNHPLVVHATLVWRPVLSEQRFLVPKNAQRQYLIKELIAHWTVLFPGSWLECTLLISWDSDCEIIHDFRTRRQLQNAIPWLKVKLWNNILKLVPCYGIMEYAIVVVSGNQQSVVQQCALFWEVDMIRRRKFTDMFEYGTILLIPSAVLSTLSVQ